MLLEVADLTVRYGPVSAVQGLDLSLDEGRLIALLGPNGAGKTSTLMALAGALPRGCVGGRATFSGSALLGSTPEQTVRRGISLVPEGRGIFEKLTVEDNLLLGATPRRNFKVEAEIGEIHERFPILHERRERRAGTLSGGEQQQLAIARALIARPKLLLLDEPSLGLAPLVVADVFALIDGLRREGTTILLVEQNAMQAIQIADHCYVLRSGRCEYSATGEEARKDRSFIDAYFGDLPGKGSGRA